MDEQLDSFILDLVNKGATDEEIDILVQDYLSSKNQAVTTSQPQQVNPDVTRQAVKTALGMLPGGVGLAFNIPVLGDFLLDTSVAAQSAISDQLPQMVASDQMRIMRKRHEEIKRTINSMQDPINKQRMIEAYASTLGVTPSSNIDDMITEYSLRQEGEIAAQKQEAQQKLTSIAAVQDIAEVNSATKLAQFIGNSLGQALGHIPTSYYTLGLSSIIMAQGSVYDQQLQRIADELGISREEVIRRGLDDPDGGQLYALIAAGLDAISAGRVLKLFKSANLGKVTQNLVNALFEGKTELAQGVLEDLGAAEGSGTEFEFDSGKALNEFLAGTIGGGGISIMTPSEAEKITEAIKEEEKQIMAEASTGVPDLDRTIDQLADEDVKEINRIADKELEIAGSKLEQQLREAQEERAKAVARQIAAEKEAQAAQAEVDRRQFIDQTRENFAASPTLTPTDLRPGDVAAEEEALIQDVEVLGVDPVTRRFIPKPPIQNAVQEQETGQVPVQSGAGSSQKMAQGESQTEAAGDLAAKKADIERRRQEELNDAVKGLTDQISTWEEIEAYTGVKTMEEAFDAIYEIADKAGRVRREQGVSGIRADYTFTEQEQKFIDFINRYLNPLTAKEPIKQSIQELKDRREKAFNSRSGNNRAAKINNKYDAELAALEAAAPATKTEPQAPTPEEGLVFTTEKGSVYTVEGQKTTRNKAKREGHEDSGPKQQSFATVYLTPTDAQKAQVIYTGGVTSRTINRDGNEVVVTDVLENGAIKTTRFPYQKTPQIGLHPFEVFEDGGAHLGNKITNISKPSKAPAEMKPVEKRVVGPVTLEDIEIESQDKDGNPITKKATRFTFSDDSGTATGNIVGKAASILEIYAETDQEGNAKRGGNLYGKVIDNLKKQGVKTVVVGMQSPASQAALAKQVEKDVLRPSTKGVMQIGGRSLPTRFNIVDTPNPKPPKVKKTKAPEKKKPVISKVAQKSEEDIEASKVRLSNLIANAVRSSEKPGKKEARLRELAARADEANFEDLYETAFSEAEKISKKREEYKKDRAERAENKKKRDANKKTREERRAEKQKAREEKEEKLAKTTQRPVAVKKGMISKEDTQMPLEKAKKEYIAKIAYFGNRGDKANYEAAIEEYFNFRKINNLTPITKDRIRKQIQTEGYISDREKIRKDVAADRGRLRDTLEKIAKLESELETTKDENRIKEIKDAIDASKKKSKELANKLAEYNIKERNLRKITSEEADKIRQQKELEEQAKKDVAEALGIDENSIDDVDFMFGFKKDGTTLRDKVIDYLEDNKIDSNTRNEISFEQFVKLAPPAQSNILNAIYRVVQKYKTKEKSNTKFYTVYVGDNAPFAGIHVSLKNSDNAYILIAVDENGKPVGQRYNRNTVLHEILHDYTKLMLTRAFKLDKSFKSKIQRTFYTLKEELSKQIEQLAKDLNKGKTLTTKQETLYSAIRMYYPELMTSTPSFAGGEYKEGNFVANVDNYEDTFYAFTNEEELLSEVFSDPRTVAFLSQVEMNEKITTGIYKGQTKSLLYKWFEDLFSFVKRNFKLTPVQNNAIDYVLDAVVEYDVPFNEETLERNEVQREFDIVSLSKAIKDNDEVLKKLQKEETKVKRNARVVAKIVGSLERRRKEITSFNDVKEYINRVNNRLPEYRRLGDTYVDITWKLIQRRRAKRDQMAGIQKEFIRKGKESARYASSVKYRQDVDDFASVSLDNLTMAEIKTYINGLNALAHDQTIQQAAYNLMISKGKMLNKKQEMLKISDKIRKGSSWIASLTSPATFSTILGKYNDSVSQTILKNIYGGLMAANARSGIEGYLFYKKLSDLATKLKLTHANLAKIGAYGSIFSTKSDPADKAAWTAEVLENAEFQLSAANAKLQSLNEKTYKRDLNKTRIEEELSVVQKLVDKIRANVSMDGILTPQETQLYNEIRKFADEHEQDFFRNTIGSWGKTPPKLFNYFPRIAQGKVGGIKSDEMQNDALIRSDADNLMEALSGNNATYEDIAGKKAFSTHERINAKGYYYDLDALSIGKIWSKSMLYDMYATTELKALNRLLKDPEFRRAMGVDLQGQFFDHLKSITGAGYRYDPTVSPLVRKLMKARDTLYTATLATGGQIFLQSSSGLVGAAVITAHLGSRGPKALSKAIAATAKVQTGNTELEKFMNERGLGIQIRDVLFEKYLSPDDFGRGVGLKKAVNEVQNATEFALRQGDKLAARLVWFAAYFDAGGTLEKPSEEAILKAERITGLLQNMSDVNMSAPIFRNNTAAKRILVGMFMAFKGFALNAYINTWYAARNLNEETARRVFISQLGSIIAYHTLQAYVVRSAYDWMLDVIDGDDDEEEEDEKRVSKQKEIIWSAAWDAVIGGAAPTIIDNYARYLVVNLAGDKLWGDPYEDFDKYKDSPLFSPTDPWDLDKAIGPGYRDVGDLVRATTEAMVAAKEAEDTLTAAEMITGVSDSNEKAAFKANQAVLKVMATATGSIVSIPFRGDFKRLLEKAAQKRREQRRKEKSMTSGGQPIEDRDLFMNGQDNMPEMYEEKNYDLIDY